MYVVFGRKLSIFPRLGCTQRDPFDILLEHCIIGYFRFVDDRLMAYKNGTTNIYDVLSLFNNIMPTMKFAMEEEKNLKN